MRWELLRKYISIDNMLIFSFIYCLTIQYFWWCNNENISIIAGVLITCIVMHIYVVNQNNIMNSDYDITKYYLMVVVPLIFIYLLRAPFFDFGGDWLAIRYTFGFHGLSGKFIHEDIYYNFMYGNILSDMVGAFWTKLLGIRAASLLALSLVLWSATILNRILIRYIKEDFLRNICILFVLCIHGLLYMDNAHWADLMGVPLCLEVICVLLINEKINYKDIGKISFLLGLCMALKFTHLYTVLPLFMYLFYKMYINGDIKCSLKWLFLALVPSLPYMIWAYSVYGDPLFSIISSKIPCGDFSVVNMYRDYGGDSFCKKLFWPVMLLSDPIKSFKFNDVFHFRIIISYVAMICGIVFAYKYNKNRNLLGLLFVSLIGYEIWGFSTGYARYAMVLEVFSGIILSVYIYDMSKNKEKLKYICFLILSVCCVMQVSMDMYLTFKSDRWGGRPEIGINREYTKLCLPHFFDKTSDFFDIQDNDVKNELKNVDVWFDAHGVLGLPVLLKEDIPVVCYYTYETKFQDLDRPKPRKRIEDAIQNYSDKNMYTFTRGNDPSLLEWIKEYLEYSKIGLKIIEVKNIRIKCDNAGTAMDCLLVKLGK